MAEIQTNLEVVPRPSDSTDDPSEIFVRLVIAPDDATYAVQMVMSVSGMLSMFNGMIEDLRQILIEDAAEGGDPGIAFSHLN
jgi:hypothetical protein